MDLDKLQAELTHDEGRVDHAYQDSEGYWTIGVGHLIDQRKNGKLSDNVINTILREDITRVVWDLDYNLSWWRKLTDERQNALANMAFNLGIHGLMGFHHFLWSLQSGEYETAARQMLESLWATQVGARAERLADAIRGRKL